MIELRWYKKKGKYPSQYPPVLKYRVKKLKNEAVGNYDSIEIKSEWEWSEWMEVPLEIVDEE